MVYSKIPCISAGTECDSLAAFPSLLGLDSYDTQTTINSPDVDQHINSLSIVCIFVLFLHQIFMLIIFSLYMYIYYVTVGKLINF